MFLPVFLLVFALLKWNNGLLLLPVLLCNARSRTASIRTTTALVVHTTTAAATAAAMTIASAFVTVSVRHDRCCCCSSISPRDSGAGSGNRWVHINVHPTTTSNRHNQYINNLILEATKHRGCFERNENINTNERNSSFQYAEDEESNCHRPMKNHALDVIDVTAEDVQRRSFLTITAAVMSSTTGLFSPMLQPSEAAAVTPLLLLQQSSSSSPPSAVTTTPFLIPNPMPQEYDLYWPLGKVAFSLLPIAGTYTRRVTLEQEIVPHTIWTHDQIQGIVNVNVPIRQTVIRLCGTTSDNRNRNTGNNTRAAASSNAAGLWVHNPVAPTKQLLRMMDRLVQLYGPVRHIVLGTVALEHKATVAAFASHYPRATVWIQPGQWSFPINLPIEYYGLQKQLLAHRLLELPKITPRSSEPTTLAINKNKKKRPSKYATSIDPIIPEWYNEIEYEMLGPFTFKAVGGYSESAFFHKSTSTLIVTDCVVSVTNDPPPILLEDPRALLYHSRDTANEPISDYYNDDNTMQRRRQQKGWRRMVQFGLVFFPSQINVTPTIGQVLNDIQSVPYNLRNLGTDAIPFNSALYPWSWNSNDADQVNFDYISQNGTLFCPPILTKLILDREPTATLQFVDRVSERFATMKRIIPCHLNNNVVVTDVKEFYHAFDMLRSPSSSSLAATVAATITNSSNNLNILPPQRALAEDLALLQKASDVLTQYNIIAPSLVCDGEPARQVGRFATKVITKK